jgi:hypothetical protein
MSLDSEVRRYIDDNLAAGWYPAQSHLRAALAALDEAEARADKAEQERDCLVRIGYYPFTRIDGVQEWHLAVSTLGRERFDTEAEAVAAVRKAAGLEDA